MWRRAKHEMLSFLHSLLRFPVQYLDHLLIISANICSLFVILHISKTEEAGKEEGLVRGADANY